MPLQVPVQEVSQVVGVDCGLFWVGRVLDCANKLPALPRLNKANVGKAI